MEQGYKDYINIRMEIGQMSQERNLLSKEQTQFIEPKYLETGIPKIIDKCHTILTAKERRVGGYVNSGKQRLIYGITKMK